MRNKGLSQYFPMIRARNEIIGEINSNVKLQAVYNSWSDDQKETFLDICTGTKGVKMLYDGYFKEILSPEINPERLSNLLSVLLKRKVTVKYTLSNDNSRLGDELSLVITDIVVELDDGTIANIEVQKLGFAFTGERASCYSADLLLRQYKRLRDSQKSNFTYKNICPVYTIVFLERSPKEFKKFKDCFIHNLYTVSDTGLELNMLQNFIFIPVDIFLENLHNEGINGELEAWLTFLGCDEPEYIVDLIEQYPYFKALYQDLYDMCMNVERIMDMFSKELQILDRNTVKYMIDEYQEELDNVKLQLNDANAQLDKTNAQLDKTNAQLDKTNAQLNEANAKLYDANATIAEKDALIARLQAELGKKE
ncbi:MAG: PD-(D/E)XK nuclease family transposase [Butyrivibrio sp.]|nr:PD-(D/E)XK nuclease family transposase [Butyrivibrio sp.]